MIANSTGHQRIAWAGLVLAATMIVCAASSGVAAPASGEGDVLVGGHSWSASDSDGDGAVTLDEFERLGRRLFEGADADRDGRVSQQEAATRPLVAGTPSRSPIVLPFMAGGSASTDRDGDGRVSRREFAAPTDAAFERLDRDRDGFLSGDELAARPGARTP